MYGVCMFLHSFYSSLLLVCLWCDLSLSFTHTTLTSTRYNFRLLFLCVPSIVLAIFFSTVNAIKIIRKFVYRLWKHDRCTITPKKMHNFVCTFLLLFKVSVSFVYFFLSSETRRFCFFQNLSIECHTHTHSHIQTNRFSLFFLNSRQ